MVHNEADRSSDQMTQSIALISSIAHSITNFRGPLIRAMIVRGVKVYALAPDYDADTRREVENIGAIPVDFSLSRTGMYPVRDLVDLFKLARLLNRLKPDIVFSYFIKPVIYGSLAAWLARVPRRFSLIAGLGYVFTPSSGRMSLRRRILKKLVACLYKLGLSVNERVLFQNPDDLSEFVSLGLLLRQKAVRVNGTGVDLEYFSESPFPEGPITFLLMARLLREKGIYEYADAARTVKALYPHIRFTLLGALDPNPGSLKVDDIENWVREGVLDWPGHYKDVRHYIKKSSVYVHPSFREGVPRSTQEAMAMGRAVITTDAIGCRETVEHGINGFLVPVRDSVALSEAMIRFIENPELIGTMGAESRRLAEQRFDVHRINAQIMSIMGMRIDDEDGKMDGGVVR